MTRNWMANRDTRSRLRLAFLIGLSTFFMELSGGLMARSLALITDSFHVLMDVAAIGLSYLAIFLAARGSKESWSYGFHRAEILASLANGIGLLFISVLVFFEALKRAISPPEIKSMTMMAIASIGLMTNLVMAIVLGKGDRERDLCLRSAYLHVLGDTASSGGVIMASILIRITGKRIFDPLASIAISSVIAFGSIRICWESIRILMEAVPKGIALRDVVEEIENTRGVVSAHKVHVWSLCSNINILSAHLVIDECYVGREREIVREVEGKMRDKFGINHMTLQLHCLCEDKPVVTELSH